MQFFRFSPACFAASDLSLDERKRIMREGSSVDDISISSSTSVLKPRSVILQAHFQHELCQRFQDFGFHYDF